MRHSPKKLYAVFSGSLIFAICLPQLFPKVQIQYLIPYLIVGIYYRPLAFNLWHAAFCGCFLDLFSSEPRFGIHALSYTATLYMVTGLRRQFFEDKLSTLPILTLLFSSISTLIHTLLIAVACQMPTYLQNPQWIMSDLCMMPVIDGVYAFLWSAVLRLFSVYHPKPRDSYILKKNGQ